MAELVFGAGSDVQFEQIVLFEWLFFDSIQFIGLYWHEKQFYIAEAHGIDNKQKLNKNLKLTVNMNQKFQKNSRHFKCYIMAMYSVVTMCKWLRYERENK